MNNKINRDNISSNRKKYAQLALQIGMPFVIFVVLFYVTFTVSSYFAYKKVYTDADQAPVADANRLVREISAELTVAGSIGQLVASLSATWDKEQVRSLAKNFVDVHPELLRITYYGMDKNSLWEVVSSPGMLLGASSPLRVIPTANFIEDFTHIATPYKLHKQQYPVYSDDGHQIGTLEMIYDITSLWPILVHTGVSDAYIVNNEGTILLSRKSLVGKEMNIRREVLRNYTSQFGKSLTRIDENGVKLVGAAVPIEMAGWVVITENSLAGAVESTSAMLTVTGLVGLVLFFVSFYEWYVAKKKIFSPLYSLQKNAETIAGGDYDAWVQVNSGNEFDTVATVMNTMAYNIRSSKKELEERIEERTRHLLQKTDEAERLSSFMVNRELRMLELKEENRKLKSIFEGEDKEFRRGGEAT